MRFAWDSAVSMKSRIGKEKREHNEGSRTIFGGRGCRSMTQMDVDRHTVVLSSAMPLTDLG